MKLFGSIGLYVITLFCLATNIEAGYTTTGRLVPSSNAPLCSVVSGRITALHVSLGQKVTKGEPLLQVDKTLFQIDYETALSQKNLAELRLEEAMQHYERIKTLWQEGKSLSTAKKTLEDAERGYLAAKEQLAQASLALQRADYHLKESLVVAPFDGVIQEIFVDIGQMLIPQTPAVRLVATDPLYLEFHLPVQLREEVQLGDRIHFSVGDASFETTISTLFPTNDAATLSFTCRASLPNLQGQYISGSFAKVSLP